MMEGRLRANSTELLLAWLLLPANINSMSSYQDYTSFFEQPECSGVLTGTVGNREAAGNLIATGSIPENNFSFNSITSYQDSKGWRESDYRRTKGLHGTMKWDATTNDGFLLDFSYSYYTKGDQNYAPYEYDSPVHADDWLEEQMLYATLGYRHHFGPHKDLLLAYRHQETDLDFFTRSSGFWSLDERVYLFTDETNQMQLPHDQIQAHYLHKIGHHQLLGGGLHYWQKKSADSAIRDEAYLLYLNNVYYLDTYYSRSRNSARQRFSSLYLQDIWDISSALTLEAALYYDIFDSSNVFTRADVKERKFNPRLGLIWKPGSNNTFRLAAFRTIVPPVLQRLDPADIAGILVSRNSYEGTSSKEISGSWEHEWQTAFFSLNLYHQQNEVSETLLDGSTQHWDGRLSGAEAVWNKLFPLSMGLRFGIRARDIANDLSPEKNRKDYMAACSLSYLHPSGIFAGAAQTYRYDNFADKERSDDGIFITDLLVGYNFPKKKGAVRLEARNIFDNHFNWVVDDFVFTQGRVPRMEITATLSLNF